MDDYLRQRRSLGSCRTPHTLNSLVKSSVDIFTKKVECCRAGCAAFSAHRKDLEACDVCHAPRYRIEGKPRMKATYWPLLPWIRILGPAWSRLWKKHERPLQLAYPKISAIGSTAKSFASSSHRATSHPTPVLPSAFSTDGFQAWRQRGFEGWPIVATILRADPSGRVQVVSQLILGITPGPSQPADLEYFFHPIAEELNALAAGVSGVAVAGYDEPQLVRAFVIMFTTDIPGGDKQLNAIGGNGENLSIFRLFSGVPQERRYYYPSCAPDDPHPSKHRLFDVLGSATPLRTATSIKPGTGCKRHAERARACLLLGLWRDERALRDTRFSSFLDLRRRRATPPLITCGKSGHSWYPMTPCTCFCEMLCPVSGSCLLGRMTSLVKICPGSCPRRSVRPLAARSRSIARRCP